MAKQADTGVYQLRNGNWAFRYTLTENGNKKDVRRSKNENGQKLRSMREAIVARDVAIRQAQSADKPKPILRRTVKEVFQEYCISGRSDRAYQTKRKQDSIWENHLCAKFGKKYVSEITPAAVMDYLSELYYVEGFSYQYTESFLKCSISFLGRRIPATICPWMPTTNCVSIRTQKSECRK